MEERINAPRASVNNVDKQVMPSGEIVYKYRGIRENASRILATIFVLVWLPSCAGGLIVENQTVGGEPSFFLISLITLVFALLVARFFIRPNETFTIVPKTGLKFLNQELPFSSIEAYYNDTKENNKIKRLKARVRGREVILTRFMPTPLADSIFEDIQRNS